ncbi:hypothetical protein PN478_15480 [Dolichospermum circinale CS-534/05]|uniref:hypothetical protein n=1 Tax=Dolichospermum circinale TaxID=109265 RepID=UPI00232D0CCB|nr:hypothetical protein [Dolichospermum circinale]MDB9491915.1 hypothetical protein [Dolichospermum circinale CS-534/05]
MAIFGLFNPAEAKISITCSLAIAFDTICLTAASISSELLPSTVVPEFDINNHPEN